MKNKLATVAAVLVGVLVVPVLVLAHHSATIYDRDKQITLRGTVTEFKLINPHPHVYFRVKDEAGNVVEWIGDSARAPSQWFNSGWGANAFKPGDTITITGAPTKDGRPMIQIRKIVSPNGKEWTEGAAGAPAAPGP